jgi:hypothetical protein
MNHLQKLNLTVEEKLQWVRKTEVWLESQLGHGNWIFYTEGDRGRGYRIEDYTGWAVMDTCIKFHNETDFLVFKLAFGL